MFVTKCANLLMDDYHFNNIEKKNLHLIILGKIKTCNPTKNGHILCNENKIVKYLMNEFLNWHWIYKGAKSIQIQKKM